MKNKKGQRIKTNPIDDICDLDPISLDMLKQSGKRLKELLGITEEDIERVIKEFRKNEW